LALLIQITSLDHSLGLLHTGLTTAKRHGKYSQIFLLIGIIRVSLTIFKSLWLFLIKTFIYSINFNDFRPDLFSSHKEVQTEYTVLKQMDTKFKE